MAARRFQRQSKCNVARDDLLSKPPATGDAYGLETRRVQILGVYGDHPAYAEAILEHSEAW